MKYMLHFRVKQASRIRSSGTACYSIAGNARPLYSPKRVQQHLRHQLCHGLIDSCMRALLYSYHKVQGQPDQAQLSQNTFKDSTNKHNTKYEFFLAACIYYCVKVPTLF